MGHNARENRGVFQSLTLAALGIVFGDIGTSPLYAMREAFHGAHAFPATHDNVLGVLSMILWSLITVIFFKYILFVMHADNRGEGGVLALTALAAPPRLAAVSDWGQILLYLGLFGSSLLFGDGIITPAISVLSAIEGLEVATPMFTPLVIPITLMILAFLFIGQRFGTAKIGAIFGPVILCWFLALALLGLRGIWENPIVLEAINPWFAARFFLINGIHGLVVLGAVFLAVTGGEALYADMGHFGKAPIQKAWLFVALPALSLNYFGQGATLLTNPEAATNPFYLMAPAWTLYPLVVLAAFATVIASQAMISGVFSLARQAVLLGYSPRFQIVHTSSEEIGQIYVPNINWALFLLTCWLVLEFRSSSALASAYGIAVSLTMIITTLLACSVAHRSWHWSSARTLVVLTVFFIIDITFFGANLIKLFDGGWVPLTVGAVVFTIMTTWRRGRQILMKRMRERLVPMVKFKDMLKAEPPARVRGTAVFMTGDPDGTPPALLHNFRHNRILHKKNILLTILTEEVPHVDRINRVQLSTMDGDFYRVTAHYGFMETPDVKDIFAACADCGVVIDLQDSTFFLGRETLLPSNRPGMAIWREHLFAFMSRNAERATAFYGIPPEQVVEMGIQVEI